MKGMKLSLRVPAKVILFGEHAAVYGEKVISGAVALYTKVLLEFSPSSFPCPNENVYCSYPSCVKATSESFFLTDINILQEKFPFDVLDPSHFPDQLREVFQSKNLNVALGCILVALFPRNTYLNRFTLDFTSSSPIGAGLGSSASFSVASVSSLITCFQIRSKECCNKCMSEENPSFCMAQLHLINSWAFMIESIFHGTPSGVDNTIATYGGFLLYEKGKPHISFSTPHQLTFMIISTNVKRNTHELVGKVGEKMKAPETKQKIQMAMRQIGEISQRGFELLKDKEEENIQQHLNKLIETNQALLRDVLGVSHAENCRAVSVLQEQFPMVRAKLTGAGGGGCVFAAVCGPQPTLDALNEIEQKSTINGFSFFAVGLDKDGVLIERIQHV